MTLESAVLHAPAELGSFNDWALERGWGDGLPLIPPTAERVAEMVVGAGRPAVDVVGIVEPRRGIASVEKVAVNAVMAGCRPDYMPVLLAAIEALLDPAVNHEGIQSTTNPGGPMVIVNGPVRDRIGLAYGPDALGPGHRANLSIGRALRLVMRNVGAGVPPADRSTQGSPWKLGMVVAEHEDASPWTPLHVDRGFRADESVVTVVNSESVINVPAAYPTADDVLAELARALGQGLNVHTSHGALPLGLNVGHARLLAAAGYSKGDVRRELFERAKVPLSALPAAGNQPMSVWTLDGDRVLVTRSADDVLPFVFGGETPYHSLCFGGWGVGGAASRAVAEPGRDEISVQRPVGGDQ